MKQEKPQRRRRDADVDQADEVDEVEQTSTESLVDDDALDDLLAEIDEVLEENAEEFVEGYVQKGGE